MNTLKVVKIGGNIIDDADALGTFLEGFAKVTGPKILVHGGGKLATKLAKQMGVEVKMTNGRRITDADTITITFPNSVSGSAVVAKGGHIVSGSIDADNISGFDVKVKTKLNLDGVFSGSDQVLLQGDVTGTASSSSIASIDGGDI